MQPAHDARQITDNFGSASSVCFYAVLLHKFFKPRVKMGTKLSVSYEGTYHPEIAPRLDRPPTFDPLYGFPKGRKPREMKATWDEMNDWNLSIGERDYCAHLLIELKRCQVRSFLIF